MAVLTNLFDLSTLARVADAAPKPTDTPPAMARLVLGALEAQTRVENRRMGMDDRPYYEVWLADLMGALPEGMTAKRAGLLCRAMGLVLTRYTKGFRVAWNEAQLGILRQALKGGR